MSLCDATACPSPESVDPATDDMAQMVGAAQGESAVAVLSTPDDVAAAQRQWEKSQRRLHRPVRHRTHASRHRRPLPSPSPIPLPPSPSLDPPRLSLCTSPLPSTHQHSAGKDPRASVFATWLVRHYGERYLRGDSSQAHPTSVSDFRRFSAQTLFAFPRVVDEALHSSRRAPVPTPAEAVPCHAERQEGGQAVCGVVDVAGGRGYLSAFLSTVYGVPTALIDPCELRLDRWRRQFQQRCQRMRERAQDGRTDVTAVPDSQRHRTLRPPPSPLKSRKDSPRSFSLTALRRVLLSLRCRRRLSPDLPLPVPLPRHLGGPSSLVFPFRPPSTRLRSLPSSSPLLLPPRRASLPFARLHSPAPQPPRLRLCAGGPAPGRSH